MAFTPAQVRKLAGKLPERFVKTRTERGMTLSYVEGWHVIDEANRVFGFDGWDRETVSAECVWQDARISPKACSYAVRVKITVRAGKTIVSREGTGIGHGTGATLGEAHESALKEAETDATKRAFITFGNLFGLALYDKAQSGVQRAKGHETGAAPVAWTLVQSDQPPRPFETPQEFCSAAKEALRQAQSASELAALWTANTPVLAQLRSAQPELRTRNGAHYADLLESLYRQQHNAFEQAAPASARTLNADDKTASEISTSIESQKMAVGEPAGAEATPIPAAEPIANLAITMPRRVGLTTHPRMDSHPLRPCPSVNRAKFASSTPVRSPVISSLPTPSSDLARPISSATITQSPCAGLTERRPSTRISCTT